MCAWGDRIRTSRAPLPEAYARALGAIIISLMIFLFQIGIHFDFSNRAIKDLWLTNPAVHTFPETQDKIAAPAKPPYKNLALCIPI
jgi:hypothetical protein